MKFEVGDDPGVIIRFLQVPIALKQRIKAHQVGKLSGPGGLAGCLLLKEDAHVVDLDDLLRVHLGNLQAPGDSLKKPFLLETGQRLPDRCPGDAETLSKRCLSNRSARLMDSGQNLTAQSPEDAFTVNAGDC